MEGALEAIHFVSEDISSIGCSHYDKGHMRMIPGGRKGSKALYLFTS